MREVQVGALHTRADFLKHDFPIKTVPDQNLVTKMKVYWVTTEVVQQLRVKSLLDTSPELGFFPLTLCTVQT